MLQSPTAGARHPSRSANKAAVVLAALLVAGCASPPPPPAAQVPALVWPGPPEPPRVAYVQSFSRAADLGISKSLLQWLGDALFGAEDLQLVRPMAVVEAAGILYVADPGSSGVHRFDRAGGRHRLLRRPDGLPLPSPIGLAVGDGGRVYVADSVLGKVFTIAPDAQAAVELPLDAALRQPTGLAWDSAGGRLFVADTAAHQVLVFDRNGRQVGTIGQRGQRDGEFNFPTLLWRAPTGLLYVSDSLNFRMQVFDTRGAFVAKFGRQGDGSGDMARHKGVATDSHGHIYVVDALLHAVQVFDAEGRLLLGFGGQGREAGEFWLPAGIFIDNTDNIYVADSYNRRVQVFRQLGDKP